MTIDSALSKLKHPSLSENFFLGNNEIPHEKKEVFPMTAFLSEELEKMDRPEPELPSYYEDATRIITSDSHTNSHKESLLLSLVSTTDCSYAEYEFFREIMAHIATLEAH